MRLLFVGDTHGVQDLAKIPVFLARANLRPQDAIIHCGDCGAAWLERGKEALDFWRGLKPKVIVCLGNHENYRWVMSQPVVRRYGCTGYDLGGRIFAPLSGQTARLGGKTVWFYPGGYSIDFAFRTPGHSIFSQELLKTEFAHRCVQAVLKRQHTDYLVSHDGPRGFVIRNFGFPISQPCGDYWKKWGSRKATVPTLALCWMPCMNGPTNTANGSLATTIGTWLWASCVACGDRRCWRIP